MPYSTIGEDVCASRRFSNRYSTLPTCSLVYFPPPSKKWARIDGGLQAINLLQFAPPPALKNPSFINHQVSIPLSLCIYDVKYAIHYSFSVLFVYIFASSLGMHFLPVRHGLVKERQAVTFRLRCQRPRAQGVSNFQPYHA